MRTMKPLLSIGIIIGLMALPAVSHAMETDYQGATPAVTQSKSLTEPAPLKFSKGEYMKSSYKDIKVSLLGPIRFTIEDDYVQKHFENFSTSRSQLVKKTEQSGAYGIDKYYKSTIAKTGFKIKF